MKKPLLILILAFSFNSVLTAQNTTGTIQLSNTTGLEYSAKIDITNTEVTLTLIGPSDRWLGLGFGVNSMTNGGDVVIFNNVSLTDRTFGGINVLPSEDTNQDWSISSNDINSGVRTLVATRSLDTGEANDYVFSTSDTNIDLVWARGNGATFTISNHGGSNRGIASNNGITLSTSDLVVSNFKLYPNPTSNNINIQSLNNLSLNNVAVFNTLGKEVLNLKASKINNSIDVSKLSKGVYFMKLTSLGKSETKRFVKF